MAVLDTAIPVVEVNDGGVAAHPTLASRSHTIPFSWIL